MAIRSNVVVKVCYYKFAKYRQHSENLLASNSNEESFY